MRSFSRAGSAGRFVPFTSAWLRVRGAAIGLLAVGLLTSERASADTHACIAAHASGQREVKAGRLTLASQLFTSCGSDSSCPEQLRAECTELLEKARTATPTVILAVLDERGGDVSQVKVYSADELIADGLDGRTVALDPGKHHLRFVLPWGEVLSADVLIREGEKNRLVQVRVEPKAKQEPSPSPVAPAAVPAPRVPPPPPARSSTPVAAWTATGVAVVGAGIFGTFAFLGSRSKADIDECAPRCPRSLEGTRDDLERSYLVADIGLGAAVVSGIVAVVLFASHGPSDQATASPSSTRLSAGLSSWSDGAGLVLSGDFR